MSLDRSKYTRALEHVPEDAFILHRNTWRGGYYVYQCDSCKAWRTHEVEDFCTNCTSPWHELLVLSDVALDRIDEIVAARQPLDTPPADLLD